MAETCRKTSRIFIFFSLIIISLGILYGCGNSDTPNNGIFAPIAPEQDSSWKKVFTGKDTICAFGAEYFFYFYQGTSNKLVIEFEGGGACWNATNCNQVIGTFSSSVDPEQFGGNLTGIHDHANPDNPFKDWSHVFIPYCTGDIHWGNKVNDYGSVKVNHKGRVNASAVLNWIYDKFEKPETIFITGVSAGSYGSIGWAPYIMNHYPDSFAIQLGDSGAGVVAEGFYSLIGDIWGADLIKPSFIPELANISNNEINIELLYETFGHYFPNNIFSQFNTNQDSIQKFFYEMMGGNTQKWSDIMNNSLLNISGQVPNFVYHVAPGSVHGIIRDDTFYGTDETGFRISSWVKSMINSTSANQ
jgi:hypothetical protein